MIKHGFSRKRVQAWDCPASKRIRNKRDKDLRLQVVSQGQYLGSKLFSSFEELRDTQEVLSDFRIQQMQEYLEVSNVWLDHLDSPEK